ncbi:MAG: ABC transporter ATP-binding protein [Candidatus Lokiarchaeota archaeon]|nr:ABC transporter ATP-binding protein [Candidatus Lokiarchaeota archaeon]
MSEINQEVVIKFKNLTKKFGKHYAVKEFNLDIPKGKIIGFLGPNGAGKSTTMKIMAQLLKPNEGEVWIRANGELQKMSSNNKHYLLKNLGFLIETPKFYKKMTPQEILKFFARLKGYPRKLINDRIDQVLKMIGMLEWKNKKLGSFSKGMTQKIGVISAVVHDPDILVLDEPQSGLDPKTRKELRDFILNQKKLGKTIFLSSHLLYEISEIADKIAIIREGKLIAFDSLDNLERKKVRRVIQFKMFKLQDLKIENVIDNLNKIIIPLTGLKEEENWVKFDNDFQTFKVFFNGDPKNQTKIHKALFESGYELLEYSVPKMGLLEDLFIELTNEKELSEV